MRLSMKDASPLSQVTSVSGTGVQVLFVDYGNSEKVSEVYYAPKEILALPPFAWECALREQVSNEREVRDEAYLFLRGEGRKIRI